MGGSKDHDNSQKRNYLSSVQSVVIPLFVFSGVLTLQIINGFQKGIASSILIVIAIVILFISGLAIFNIHKYEKFDKLKIVVIALMVILGTSFVCFGYIKWSEQEVNFLYPTDGSPVPRDVSMFGTYSNIDNNTYIWLYVVTQGNKWFIKPVNTYPQSPGSNRGTWRVPNSTIGDSEDKSTYFIIGFLLIDKAGNDTYWNTITPENGFNGYEELPQVPGLKKLGNITISRY